MKNLLSKYKNTLICTLLTMVCACFFVYVLTLFHEYSGGVQAQASQRADFYTEEQSRYVGERMDAIKREAEYAAKKASAATDRDGVVQQLCDVRETLYDDEMFLDVFYFKDGELFATGGSLISSYPELSALDGNNETTLSKIFQYDNRLMSIAACAPTNGGFADGVVMLFDRNAVSLHTPSGEIAQGTGAENAAFALLCKHDGKIVDRIENTSVFTIGNEPVQNGIVKQLFSDAASRESIEDALHSGTAQSFSFSIDGDGYVLGVHSFGEKNGDLSLVSVYKTADIYGEGFTVMQSIAAALLGLSAVIAVMICSIIVSGVRARRKIYRLEMLVSDLNCSTLKRFEKDADEILKRHATADFAFVSLQINNFGYVSEHFGEETARKLLKYAADTIRHTMYLEETFGYISDGEFILLLHYRDKQAFTERLNGVHLRLSAFNEFGEDYKASATFAAYVTEREEKQTLRQMIEKLNLAKEASPTQKATFTLSFYEDAIRTSYMKKAEIEGKMEQALKNSEFHLFYQPKYNLRQKTLDGCEILVRWYDPELEKYHLPSEFLPVFEENGFIAKLDRFVFFKACENLAQRAAERHICYPISVNVSRVTAIQPDFVDYYVRIKNKFNIKDDFITLEFTESFAYENYEFLKRVVNRLHENGLLCSIDDFGTGYSSYNILKTIETDEIKLDKFFLGKGFSAERDRIVLESVIEMVRKLGIKVTQEGVETKEDMFRLEELGCDVMQGYYFAKPMKYSDYCSFIDDNFV